MSDMRHMTDDVPNISATPRGEEDDSGPVESLMMLTQHTTVCFYNPL